MLSVSRKRVQEMFTEAQKSAPSCEYDRGFRGAELTILRNLFGSKCLPDNVDSSEPKKSRCEKCGAPNSSICAHMNCQDYKLQSEPKLKRCDKVITPSGEARIIEDTHFENGSWLYLVGDPAQWISESDLEPYIEPEGDTSPNVSHSDIDIDELVAKGYLPDPAKQFDTILKDSFSKERRLNIATTIAAALAVDYYHESYGESNKWQRLAKLSMTIADALIAEAEKGSSNAEPVK